MSNVRHLPHASSVCGTAPTEQTDPARIANTLWVRIHQAQAVLQCIQQQALDHGDPENLSGALAGAAFDQLGLALADIRTLEACIH